MGCRVGPGNFRFGVICISNLHINTRRAGCHMGPGSVRVGVYLHNNLHTNERRAGAGDGAVARGAGQLQLGGHWHIAFA